MEARPAALKVGTKVGGKFTVRMPCAPRLWTAAACCRFHPSAALLRRGIASRLAWEKAASGLPQSMGLRPSGKIFPNLCNLFPGTRQDMGRRPWLSQLSDNRLSLHPPHLAS